MQEGHNYFDQAAIDSDTPPHILLLDISVLIVLFLHIFFNQKFYLHSVPCFPSLNALK